MEHTDASLRVLFYETLSMFLKRYENQPALRDDLADLMALAKRRYEDNYVDSTGNIRSKYVCIVNESFKLKGTTEVQNRDLVLENSDYYGLIMSINAKMIDFLLSDSIVRDLKAMNLADMLELDQTRYVHYEATNDEKEKYHLDFYAFRMKFTKYRITPVDTKNGTA